MNDDLKKNRALFEDVGKFKMVSSKPLINDTFVDELQNFNKSVLEYNISIDSLKIQMDYMDKEVLIVSFLITPKNVKNIEEARTEIFNALKSKISIFSRDVRTAIYSKQGIFEVKILIDLSVDVDDLIQAAIVRLIPDNLHQYLDY